MREIKFKYIWRRPKSGAGPYRPTDAKTVVSYITLDELEKGKKLTSPQPCSYYLIVARCQYTGLHDKNGKEIYEGDILLADEEYVDEGELYLEVKWNDAQTGFYLYDTKYDFDCDREEFELIDKSYQVIGNIYENPELLEVK